MQTHNDKDPIFGRTVRNPCRRKLLVDEKIEVRSVEEGSLGAWYLGTVITSNKRFRRTIRYHDLLSDDGSEYFVDTVQVSEVVEGLIPECEAVDETYRGRLRPLPPKVEVDRVSLEYGVCVDVFFSDAWWEGVVFDHGNGSGKRRVFFPDLGDELDAEIESLRVTQDWNESAGTWECRGRWMFLDLVDKYREENYLPVSVKQLWYDVRVKVGFARIGEWTCSFRHLWEDLMMEVINDNLEITISQLLLDYDAEIERNSHQELKLLEEASQEVTETDLCSSGVLVIAPQEQQLSCIEKDEEPACERYQSLAVLTSVSDRQGEEDEEPSCERYQSLSVLTSLSGITPEASYINRVTEFSSERSTAAHRDMKLSKKPGKWRPFDCDAKSCPQAVSSYIRVKSQKVALHVKKHLKYMGWTIEHTVDEGGTSRFRYLSPDGRVNEQSLRQVCFILKQRDESLIPPEVAKPLSRPCENWIYNTQEMNMSIVMALPAFRKSVALDNGRKPSAETLLECETQGEKEVFKKESYNFYPRNTIPTRNRTLRVRLEPNTKPELFIRLKSKCKQKSYNSKKNKVIAGLRNVNLSTRRGRTSRMLTDIKNRVIGRGKTRVSRSIKRVHRVITPIAKHHSPRTILSWLIDNNVVLPRENIRCRNQKDQSVRKEGKLTREGIKCSCCRKIFTISGFEVHGDGGSCRAAANIFLDDGRSLLECQVEAYKTRKKAQPPDILKMKLRHGENDIICSVCQYGGNLILCDGCPAAFHANCLGLEDVPDGDWFCVSCCCGACGQPVLKATSKCAKVEEFLSCKQCELKYHPSCLHGDGAGDSLDTFLGEKWFCSKGCQKIFVNLCELIGKPRVVGGEKNLIWRLVQSSEPDKPETDTSKIEAVAENHCKLSVALDVMHELFEPVKNSHGGGDLAENIIFSRWSRFKRLNFTGFYTVLLEKNEELVTVATVRIFGNKVAEMPFIGTRFQYRQHGLCRVLMNELEKVLTDWGVERLFLPAVPCVLNTWINSFGFTKMATSERKDFLQFTFLEFGRTIMCQKILIKSSVPDPVPSTVSSGKSQCEILMIEDNPASDDRSEVHQAEQQLEEASSTKNPPVEIKTHQERLPVLKFYTRRRSKCMKLT